MYDNKRVVAREHESSCLIALLRLPLGEGGVARPRLLAPALGPLYFTLSHQQHPDSHTAIAIMVGHQATHGSTQSTQS